MVSDSQVLANGYVASLCPGHFDRVHLRVEGSKIAWIGTEIPAGDHVVLNLSGKIIAPGNVCAHTHLYSSLARGMPAPKKSPRNFHEILEQVWWRLDRALDEDSIRSSALVGALDAVVCGTTTVIDHHASPSCIGGSLDVIADALETVGLRGLLCYEVSDRGGVGERAAGLAENARFLSTPPRPTIRACVGAHASFTLGDTALHELAELASHFETGIHIHVAEDGFDEQDSLRRAGKRTAQRLADAGVLRSASIAAHGVHLDSSELDVIRRQGSWLAHNCRSNLNNGVGHAPLGLPGDRIVLGTDGLDHDMFEETRASFLLAREQYIDFGADDAAGQLAAGSDLVSSYFEDTIGAIAPGAQADLVVLDYEPASPMTPENLTWHWIFGMGARHVESVMVAGRWVVFERETPNIDSEKIRRVAQTRARHLWSRMENL